jgi:uncharacterized protein (UPF0218 family)
MWRLPEELRPVFQEPFGPVLSTKELLDSWSGDDTVVAVGDVVARTLIENGLAPRAIVVDYRTQRGGEDAELRRVLGGWGDRVVRVANPAGTVTQELVDALLEALQARGTTRIEVDGEEDLAGLPLFAYAPLGTIILYGMPNRGVVRAVADADRRAKARDLLARMRTE